MRRCKEKRKKSKGVRVMAVAQGGRHEVGKVEQSAITKIVG